MADRDDNSTAEKISNPFRSRLSKLGPKETLRAIVRIRTPHHGKSTGRRQSPKERQAMIAAIQTAAASALEELDRVLEEHGGKRLAESPNALGCIPIEATGGGLLAVAESDLVEAVLEDQPISPLKRP
ncbi:MAG: hypothetical protein ACYTG0_02430 [Planctomycetota bacterium]|jgi:hypothetical protein